MTEIELIWNNDFISLEIIKNYHNMTPGQSKLARQDQYLKLATCCRVQFKECCGYDNAVVVVDFNWSCSVQRVDRDSKWLPKEATPDLRGAPHLMGWSRMTLVWASLVIVPVRFF